jgi:filamentous hemagglutinin
MQAMRRLCLCRLTRIAMNKNLHRIIFNPARGQRMAVAETASAQGKAAGGETSGASAAPATLANLHPLRFAVLSALGMVLWLQPAAFTPVHAQIVAAPDAPASQRPTVLQTANGLPQVNIQTPSAAGVSRNVYNQFDVQRNGAILNNSRTNVQTQLGGFNAANPWLARRRRNSVCDTRTQQVQRTEANSGGHLCSGTCVE